MLLRDALSNSFGGSSQRAASSTSMPSPVEDVHIVSSVLRASLRAGCTRGTVHWRHLRGCHRDAKLKDGQNNRARTRGTKPPKPGQSEEPALPPKTRLITARHRQSDVRCQRAFVNQPWEIILWAPGLARTSAWCLGLVFVFRELQAVMDSRTVDGATRCTMVTVS